MSQAPETDGGIAEHLSRRLPFFYGWVVVFISFLCVFMMGATSFWAIPIFVGPISDDTGWGHTWIFTGLAVRFIVGATGGLLFGRLVDRRGGAARLLLIGILVDACALISLRFVETPLQFVLVYGLVGGAGGTGVRLVQATLIAKWFVARRGVAVGFAANGGGISALIMAPATAFLISELGWRDAWGALAVIMLLLLLPFVPLAVRGPEDLGLQPDNGAIPRASVRNASSERSFSLGEVVQRWQFWLLLLGVLFGNFSLQTHTVVMVPFFEEIGISSTTAASSLSIYGVFSISMRFVWGMLADRVSVRLAIIAQSILTGLGALLLLQVTGTSSMYIFMAYQGMTLSGFPPLQILVWPEFFGRMHIGSIVGMTQFFSTIAGAGGAVLAGFIFDQTGTYGTTLWLLIGTWLVCATVMFAVKPAQRAVVAAESPT